MLLSKTLTYGGLVIAMALPMAGAEAKAFHVAITGAKDITLNQDHLSVSLLHGWVSSKDSFFKALLSQKKKLAISIGGEVAYFDGDKNTYSKLLENTDIERNTDRPWGAVLSLIDAQPADASSKVTFKLGIYRDDRFNDILNAAKGAEPPNLVQQMDLWIGYGRLLSAVLSTVVGTTATNYPFILESDIKASGMIVDGKMKEHYIVGVSPNKDGDPFLLQINAAQLTYDEASQILKYNGQTLTDHSYVVLKVTKADAPDITRLLAESKAPWAVLGVTQFLSIPTLDVQNRDQVIVLAKNLLTQLKTELELLKNEHRFSAYDRAKALYSFANESKDVVSSTCTSLQVGTLLCPTRDLEQFIGQIKRNFGLPDNAPTPTPINLRSLRQQMGR
jgi:hypothetical protein